MSNLILLVLGLVLFIGGHAVTRMQGMRARLIARWGQNTYRLGYSVVAITGFVLIVYGFASYRAAGMIPVWNSPRWMAHLVIPLMWVSLILLTATYLPGRIKAKARHPMLLAVKIWAFTHLLANGDLGSILLFGAFLGWAVYARIALKRAAAIEGAPGAGMVAGSARNDALALLIGSVATALFVLWLHKLLIGVAIIGV
jgi:uncharacterized membrane protein